MIIPMMIVTIMERMIMKQGPFRNIFDMGSGDHETDCII